MKKTLSLLGTITLIGTSTTSLVACNNVPVESKEYTPEELEKIKEKNKIDANDENIKNNLEWVAPQEKPFNQADNKYYYVLWHGNKNDNWRIIKFKNNEEQRKKQILEDYKNFRLILHNQKVLYIINKNVVGIQWDIKNFNYFKAVYRWNLDNNAPDLIIDDKDNVKVNGEKKDL